MTQKINVSISCYIINFIHVCDDFVVFLINMAPMAVFKIIILIHSCQITTRSRKINFMLYEIILGNLYFMLKYIKVTSKSSFRLILKKNGPCLSDFQY